MVESYKSFLSQDDFWDAYAIDSVARQQLVLGLVYLRLVPYCWSRSRTPRPWR